MFVGVEKSYFMAAETLKMLLGRTVPGLPTPIHLCAESADISAAYFLHVARQARANEVVLKHWTDAFGTLDILSITLKPQ